MIGFKTLNLLIVTTLFAAMPASSSYSLHNYGFGSGGTGGSTSSNYKLNGISGEVSGQQTTSTNYNLGAGNNSTQQAHVPTISLSNGANYYNKLKFIISPGANPSDTTFTIAISTDNFASTNYIQADDTIGATKVYQTYSAWGGASGQFALGLTPSTTYYVKVNAMQGNFTETGYGPVSSVATVAPSITFDIDVSASNSDTSPPYATSFGNLLPATVTTSAEKVWIDLDTNAESGAKVYAKSTNAGFRSPTANFTITSASADLAVAASGYGAQDASVAQTSGGPLSMTAPYNGATQNVGILDTLIREIFSSSAPITGGRGSFQLKAKATSQTPAEPDYTDTLTLTAAGAF